jgi:hypothetical protein
MSGMNKLKYLGHFIINPTNNDLELNQGSYAKHSETQLPERHHILVNYFHLHLCHINCGVYYWTAMYIVVVLLLHVDGLR